MKPFLRIIAAFAALAIVGSIMSATGSAQAAPAAPSERATTPALVAKAERDAQRAVRCFRKCFGAVSMSRDQAWGGYINTPTRKGAIQRAHKRCKSLSNYPGQCRKLGWVRNGCMAVAIKTNSQGWITSWATGYANRKAVANRKAKKRNGGGKIRASICTAN
ncbi:DUF4189 domain-containing protein [Nocardioides sp. TF02-7]|uniref:DUF4189 domain-containing protein n=1 Tax=Nocardioides sp. TF02-7 TaxID=2917724 RepID=UPI001F050617|nr:DUF4189 domain-containing protein [Nocardioides sp. TF02-7]UMG93835.1 DUF4189 domain-containing protein [Nocardioides sp. TF02-7]